MDRDEALKLLGAGAKGIAEWNRRRTEGEEIPRLLAAALVGDYFEGADLSRANLRDVRLNGAVLARAKLIEADLAGADLRGTNLVGANFSRARLCGMDVSKASMGFTILADVDLSEVKGLAEVRHHSPSAIGLQTLQKSKEVPTEFFEGCGVPDSLITYLPSLLGQPFEFYSCFISYSTADTEFCDRLHSRMRQEHLRVWYSPHDIQGGKTLIDQIDSAIRLHNKLLIVLTEHSMRSDWVATEIRKARQREEKEGKRVLFPIRLVDYETIQAWERFDADTGRDMAVDIREYFIPDFSNWKDHDSFEEAFGKLLRDLGAEE